MTKKLNRIKTINCNKDTLEQKQIPCPFHSQAKLADVNTRAF